MARTIKIILLLLISGIVFDGFSQKLDNAKAKFKLPSISKDFVAPPVYIMSGLSLDHSLDTLLSESPYKFNTKITPHGSILTDSLDFILLSSKYEKSMYEFFGVKLAVNELNKSKVKTIDNQTTQIKGIDSSQLKTIANVPMPTIDSLEVYTTDSLTDERQIALTDSLIYVDTLTKGLTVINDSTEWSEASDSLETVNNEAKRDSLNFMGDSLLVDSISVDTLLLGKEEFLRDSIGIADDSLNVASGEQQIPLTDSTVVFKEVTPINELDSTSTMSNIKVSDANLLGNTTMRPVTYKIGDFSKTPNRTFSFEEPKDETVVDQKDKPVKVTQVTTIRDSVLYDGRYLVIRDDKKASKEDILKSDDQSNDRNKADKNKEDNQMNSTDASTYEKLTEMERRRQLIETAELDRELKRQRFELEKMETLARIEAMKNNSNNNVAAENKTKVVEVPKQIIEKPVNVIQGELTKTVVVPVPVPVTPVQNNNEVPTVDPAIEKVENLERLVLEKQIEDSLLRAKDSEKVDARFQNIEVKLDTLINAIGKKVVINNAGLTTLKEKHSLYFKLNSSTVSENQKNLLNNYLFDVKKDGGVKMIISGFTDSSGNADYNLILSRKRAEAVQQLLVQMGYSKVNILLNNFGEKSAKKQYNSSERKVEIELKK